MKIVMQPEGSSLCGQSCVAMIAGVSLEDSIAAFGKRGGTRTKEVAKALSVFGIKSKDCLTRITKTNVPSEKCIVHVVWRNSQGKPRGHWIVRYQGQYYDPGNGILNDYQIEWGKLTSFLEIS